MIDPNKMRIAGNLVWETFQHLEPHIIEGTSTGDLNQLAHDFIISKGGYPAPLGYTMEGHPPFPKSICTSVNNIAAHGVPLDSELLINGDIISIDISLSIDGHFADACRTYPVGTIADEVEDFIDLCQITHALLIEYVHDNLGKITTADLGAYTERLADIHGIYPIHGFGGHGIGHQLHCDPFIPPSSIQGPGVLLQPGMFITIEPIFTMRPTAVKLAPDRWSIFAPGVLSAQFEHTLYLSPLGVEILT